MSNYKISVITPYHNTDFDLFDRADKSMRNQTIGFENIEWVIIMHNCEKEYIDKVTTMYKNDNNVIVKILNNDKHTPGSPRNEAFKYISSKYLIFLDSDDSFSLDCLEKVVSEMEKTKSDMLRFRMEAIAADKKVEVVSILSSANATYERIICDKGDWNLDAMFSGYYGCCATQVYKIDFLRKNNICFNEEQLAYEDLLFNAEAITVADRVCILPQYIGYQYYQNAKSTVRSLDKTDTEVIEMAKGIDRIFKRMLDHGADITFYTYGLIGFILCNFLAYSKKVTYKGRLKVKEIVGKYVNGMNLLSSNKFYDFEKVNYLYNRAKAIVLFPENPVYNMNKNELNGVFTLMGIIRNNINTDYGKRYHFSEFKNENAFIYQVPLSDEKTYKPYVDLMHRVSERNLIVEDDIYGYIKTNKDILLPVTQNFILDLANKMISELTGHYTYYINKFESNGAVSADGVGIDYLECFMFKCYSSLLVFTYNRSDVMHNIESSSYLNRYYGDENVYENLLLDALANKKIDQIVSQNAEKIFNTFEFFESNYKELIEKSKCNDIRKEELIKICENGFNGIAKKIWPKLKRVVGFGGGKYKKSFDKLKKYIEGTTYNHGSYFTEYGILGTAEKDNSDIFEIHKNKYFIELLDVEENKTVLLTDSIVDKTYEIIMTNENGLYRYKTNEFIKPVIVSNDEFKYRFVN